MDIKNIGLEKLVKDSIKSLTSIKEDLQDNIKIHEIDSLIEYYKEYENQFIERTNERDELIAKIAVLKKEIQEKDEKIQKLKKTSDRMKKIKSGEIKPALKVSDEELIKIKKTGVTDYRVAKILGMKPQSITPRINKIIKNLYTNGMTIEEISKEFNINIEQVKSKIK